MDDHFRPIEGFPGYRVSRSGEVQSCWLRRGRFSLVTDTWTPLGISTGLRPMRDMIYQTSQRTSPPTPLWRATRSVITPCDVEMMAMPRPLRTFGTCLAGT